MEKITKIIQWFSQQSSFIKLNNKLNLNNINIHKEFEFMQILNLLYGYNLESTNTKRSNFPAIDLIDNKNKIAVQVTSDTSINKIKDTLEKIKNTDYKDYEIIFLYLCDETPKNTRKKIDEFNFNCKCLSFIDLIREFQNNTKAINEFLYKMEQKDVYEYLCEYLILPNQWIFDGNGMAFCKLNPNYEVVELDNPSWNRPVEYWLNSVNYISKHYNKKKSIPIYDIQINYNTKNIKSTFLYSFHEENLTIAPPSQYFIQTPYKSIIALYLEGYIANDKDASKNIKARLTYLYYLYGEENINLSFNDFINKRNVLHYNKTYDNSKWIPIIFFQDEEEQNKFSEFVKDNINKFDYSKVSEKYEDKIDFNWNNEDAIINCCFHYWAYDLYWDCFKGK